MAVLDLRRGRYVTCDYPVLGGHLSRDLPFARVIIKC